MQEFILYSLIPAAREAQVLNILAGLTGTQPTPIHEQHLIYAQLKVPDLPAVSKRSGAAGNKTPSVPSTGVPNLRPQYQKLIRQLHFRGDSSSSSSSGSGDHLDAQPWDLRTEHVPEPGAAVIARAATELPASAADLARLRNPADARFVTQYVVAGSRFVHGNVVVRVWRMRVRARTRAGAGMGKGAEEGKEEVDVIDAPPPRLETLGFVDPSGAWMVEAAVRVEDGGNARVTAAATRELQGFAAEMGGAVNLVAPDRLALDTRVKNV